MLRGHVPAPDARIKSSKSSFARAFATFTLALRGPLCGPLFVKIDVESPTTLKLADQLAILSTPLLHERLRSFVARTSTTPSVPRRHRHTRRLPTRSVEAQASDTTKHIRL
jgi:hypothetical protein